MEFFIRKNANQPILRMELIKDGRFDYNNFYELIQNANIYFSMINVDNGEYKIAKNLAGCELVDNMGDTVDEEYYITYKFTSRQTAKTGRFEGIFYIDMLNGDGTLIAPVREKLYINII